MPLEAKNSGSENSSVYLPTEEFLKRLANDFSIQRTYYPGSWDDKRLEQSFGRNRIFTLDEDRVAGMPNFVQGQMELSPFLNDVFDAVFLQDVGANERELADVLRTLRTNGIVIHSYSDCCDEDLPLLQEHPQLTSLKTPYYNGDLHLFRKL